MAIRVPKRDVGEVQTQVSTRNSVELAKKLRVYAVTNDLRVSDIIAAGIKAVISEKSAA